MLASCLACLAIACGAHPERERIVLISIDTLRYDALAHMPHLAARAKAGRSFARYYAACSCTQPSHASLFTGLAPWEHGVSRNGLVLSDRVETIAETLRANGFATRAVVGSLPLKREFGFAQGFDVFRDEFDRRMPFSKWDGLEIGDALFYSLGMRVTDQAIAELDRSSEPRQFLFVHYFDAHAPYGDTRNGETWSPARILGEIKAQRDAASALGDARAAYDADVESLDLALDRLLERVARDAGSIETHLVILADHGESFGEDGVVSHGSRVSDEQIHVPLMVISPRAKPGVESTPVGTLDVHATLLSLAGLRAKAGEARDLLALPLLPRAVSGMRRTYAEPFDDALVDGRVDRARDHAFFVVDGERTYTGDANLVELGDVRGTAQSGDRVTELERLFAKLAQSVEEHHTEELHDEKAMQALRALGYTR